MKKLVLLGGLLVALCTITTAQNNIETMEEKLIVNTLENLEGFFIKQQKSGQVQLSWLTARDLNPERFVIEKAIKGNAFFDIGELEGKGLSNYKRSYIFFDTNPFQGVNYYRIKSFDKTGAFKYSKVLELNYTPPFTIQCAPNPFIEDLHIDLSGDLKYANLRIFHISGVEIKPMRIVVQSEHYVLPLGHLPSGVYFVEVDNIFYKQQVKVIKE